MGAGPSAPGGHSLGSELMTLALGRESGGILRLPSWDSLATLGGSEGQVSRRGPLARQGGSSLPSEKVPSALGQLRVGPAGLGWCRYWPALVFYCRCKKLLIL